VRFGALASLVVAEPSLSSNGDGLSSVLHLPRDDSRRCFIV
jgi:hypothetical protein